MKLKHKFVSPKIARSVPVYPEWDYLQTTSLTQVSNVTIMGQEVVDHSPSYFEEKDWE